MQSLFTIQDIIPGEKAIHPLSPDLLAEAQSRLDSLTKPRGSLGRLEEIAMRLHAMRCGMEVSPALVFTVAGDHGVAREGVSPFPQEVTRQMVENFLHHGAGINALSKANGLDLVIVDAGCSGGPYSSPEIISMRLGDGTDDLALGPAMSPETCLQGLKNGVSLVRNFADKGYRCFAIGEMGIANTTPASALYAFLLGLTPEDAVGPGTGAGPEMIAHKAEIIRKAFRSNEATLARRLPDGRPDPAAALTCLGGCRLLFCLPRLSRTCPQASYGKARYHDTSSRMGTAASQPWHAPRRRHRRRDGLPASEKRCCYLHPDGHLCRSQRF